MKKKIEDKMNEDVLLREVIEEVKNEQLQQFWNKYGLYIIIGVAFILTATISFESLKNWQIKKQQELSNAYSVALSLQNQGRLDESLDIYATLSDKAAGIYADIARLQIANIYMEQGKSENALDVFQALIDNKKTIPQMKTIAILKLASYKLNNNAPAEEVTSLLEHVLSDTEGSEIARELSAMLFIREQDIINAKAEYQKIINSDNASDALKSRATDMINLLDSAN